MAGTTKKGAALALDTLWDWIKNYLFLLVPTLPAAAAWVSAQMQEFPVWALIVIAGFVFWASASGLRAAIEIAAKTQVKGKLVLGGLSLRHHTDANGAFDALGIAVAIVNTSPRVLQYEVESIRTMIDGRVNTNPDYANMGGMVSPMVGTTFNDATVPIAALVPGKVLNGTFGIVLRYGAPGRLRYTLEGRYKIAIKAKAPDTIEAFDWFNQP